MGSRLASKVRNARIAAVAIAIATLVLFPGVVSFSASWAQAQASRPTPGMYKVTNYTVDGEPKPKLARKTKPLFLKPNDRYIWAGYHAPFRMRGQAIDLDCQPVSGVVSLQVSKFTITLTEFVQGLEGFKEEHKTYFEYEADAFPAKEPTADDCKWKFHQRGSGGSAVGPGTAGRPQRGALVASLQAQAVEERGVNGQVLLAIGGRADVDLWVCLVENGYPDVLIGEPGATPTEVSVFPGGRFRADLRGGIVYNWAFLTSGCETPTRQPDPAANVGPGPNQRPVTEEKIVLGCYVLGGALTRCTGWWLTRPE